MCPAASQPSPYRWYRYKMGNRKPRERANIISRTRMTASTRMIYLSAATFNIGRRSAFRYNLMYCFKLLLRFESNGVIQTRVQAFKRPRTA